MNHSRPQDKKETALPSRDRPIYLDSHATTPVDSRVLESMSVYNNIEYGNPHSSHHFGESASNSVENARRQVADIVGAMDSEIIFTSGATEANNLAILGLRELIDSGKNHIITVSTEHKCVLASVTEMKRLGFRVDILNVDYDGLINIDILREKLSIDTALVSIMLANNEIGVIQPIREIGELCQEYGAIFHTDAAQAIGKLPIDVDELSIDLLSISGHKIYGPKGIGALFVRNEIKGKLRPIIFGGNQEAGLRSGTLPVPLCVGLGVACSIGQERMDRDLKIIGEQRDRFFEILRSRMPGIQLNGSVKSRLYNNLNLCFPGIDSENLLACIYTRVSASTGSACTTGIIEPSHVLTAIGLTDEQIRSSLRFGFGRGLALSDIEFAAGVIASEAERLMAVA